MEIQDTDLNFLNPFLKMISLEEDILYKILEELSEETIIALGYTCKDADNYLKYFMFGTDC